MIIFLSKVLIPIALASVAAVLLMGLFNMMRGGSPNRSQNLMRWRVFLQFIAIVLAMLTIWVMGQG
jgi:heme/copper-type cytochrome/quinol oxidase subunit 4